MSDSADATGNSSALNDSIASSDVGLQDATKVVLDRITTNCVEAVS